MKSFFPWVTRFLALIIVDVSIPVYKHPHIKNNMLKCQRNRSFSFIKILQKKKSPPPPKKNLPMPFKMTNILLIIKKNNFSPFLSTVMVNKQLFFSLCINKQHVIFFFFAFTPKTLQILNFNVTYLFKSVFVQWDKMHDPILF